jgi:hypothetical protein
MEKKKILTEFKTICSSLRFAGNDSRRHLENEIFIIVLQW